MKSMKQMVEKEITKGGSHIRRYDDSISKMREVVSGDDQLIETIAEHVEKHLGAISYVIHEIISEEVHVDIHIVEPQKDRNYFTLVTSGMSEKPMILETSEGNFEVYAELMISLPPEWKIGEEDWEDEAYYWPIRWLSKLAYLPHKYDTCIWESHSVPNGDPPQPLAHNNNFIGFIIGLPLLAPEEFIVLEDNNKITMFFAIYPVYQDEINYKLENGADNFFELATRSNITELVDITRESIAPKKNLMKRILSSFRFKA